MFEINGFQPVKSGFAGQGGKIGFVSQIFFDGIDSKGFLTPEKRFRNEFPARRPGASPCNLVRTGARR
jgi:hypothetical protein